MSLSREFFELALALELKSDQASQRRAISTAYYAVFHAIAEALTASIVGYDQPFAEMPLSEEWVRVYRSIDHRTLREALKHFAQADRALGLLEDTARFDGISSSFSMLQDKRNSADYDPYFDVTSISLAQAAIAEALFVIGSLKTMLDVTLTRKLAIEVLLKNKTKR